MAMLEPNPEVVETIVGKLKTNGMFDEMRRKCLADIDTKPAFQNLKQRVENFVNSLLLDETWTPSLNKNQLRAKVRTSVMRSGMLTSGVEHILHQVVDAKSYSEFLPRISEYISENYNSLFKELRPQSGTEDFVRLGQVSDTQPDQNNEVVDMERSSTKSELSEELTEKNVDAGEETKMPEIPEGAANTLRTFIQSLISNDLKSIVNIAKEDNDDKAEPSNQESSPSLNSSQIESFTDEDNDAAETAKSADGGPHTPVDSVANTTSPVISGSPPTGDPHQKHSYSPTSSESEDHESVHEDLGKVDSDASFESAGDVDPNSDCEVVVNDMNEEHTVESDDVNDHSRTDDNDDNRGDEALNISETFDPPVEEVEVLELAGNENVIMEDSIENAEIPVEIAPVVEESAEEVLHHSHRERKRRHKKHRRRRHSSVDDDSDESVRAATFSERDSSEEAREEVGPTKSRLKKKKKKKRSKKLKRSKSRARDSSQERLQWETSSEYRRSSLSPNHLDANQRHFIPSPPSQQTPVHFDDNNRSVKVEPAFMQAAPRFRDPYALEPDDHRHPPKTADHPFPVGHPDSGMAPFPPSNFPRSPPHYPPHGHPRFPYGHPRFSPPYGRMPYPMRPGSPPPRRYSPTFDYFRPPMRPRFDMPGPPRSPPHQRRFSPPRQMGRFPAGMPPPHMYPRPPDERFMMRPGMSGAHMMPPGPMMRPDMPPGPPVDMRRPDMPPGPSVDMRRPPMR